MIYRKYDASKTLMFWKSKFSKNLEVSMINQDQSSSTNQSVSFQPRDIF